MLTKPLERVEEMAFHETSDSFYVDDDDDENMDPERDDSDKYGKLDFARLKCLNVTRPPWDDNIGEVFEWFTDATIARIKTLKFKFGIRLGTLESVCDITRILSHRLITTDTISPASFLSSFLDSRVSLISRSQ